MTHSEALRDLLRLDKASPALQLTQRHRDALQRAVVVLEDEERVRRSEDDTGKIGPGR